MMAKASVVGFLITWDDQSYRGKTSVSSSPCNKDDGNSEPLIKLTDHEAALAELKSERDAWQRLAGEWQQATERRKKESHTLLTSLEALAGEMDSMLEGREIFRADVEGVADKLRTLASSATGEKNTEEVVS